MEALWRAKDRLLSLGIARIGLFGSFVRNEGGPDSDVDLLVEFDPEKHTFDSFMDACFFLEDLLRRRVDLVTADSLSPYIKPHILVELEDVPLTR